MPDTAFWMGMGSLMTAASGAIGVGLKTVYDKLRERRKDAVEEVWRYAAELKSQNERQQAVIEQHGRAVEALAREGADCRESEAELRQALHFVYDYLKRAFRALKEFGHDQGELPELPPMRPRSAGGGDFLARQAQQSAEATKEAASTIHRPVGGPAK